MSLQGENAFLEFILRCYPKAANLVDPHTSYIVGFTCPIRCYCILTGLILIGSRLLTTMCQRLLDFSVTDVTLAHTLMRMFCQFNCCPKFVRIVPVIQLCTLLDYQSQKRRLAGITVNS